MSTLFYQNVGGAGVSSVNTLTGDIILAAGSNVTITPSGNTLTISAAGGSGAPGGANQSIQYNNTGAFDGFGSWNGFVASLPALSVAGATSLLSSLQVRVNTVSNNYIIT